MTVDRSKQGKSKIFGEESKTLHTDGASLELLSRLKDSRKNGIACIYFNVTGNQLLTSR